MISFGLEEDQQIIQETVRKFAAEELRPKMREFEKSGVPDGAAPQVRRDSGSGSSDVGLADAPVPGARGAGVRRPGRGRGAVGAVRRQRARSPRSATTRSAARFAGKATRDLLTSERKAPLDGFATVARRVGGGWSLTGKKAFVVDGGDGRPARRVRAARRCRAAPAGTASARSSSRRATRGCASATSTRCSASRRSPRTRSSSRAARSPTAIGCWPAASWSSALEHVFARTHGDQRRAAGGPGARRLRVRARVHAGAQGVRQAGRALPVDRVHARRHGDGRRGRALDGVARRHRARQGQPGRRRSRPRRTPTRRPGASPTTACSSSAAPATSRTTRSRSGCATPRRWRCSRRRRRSPSWRSPASSSARRSATGLPSTAIQPFFT